VTSPERPPSSAEVSRRLARLRADVTAAEAMRPPARDPFTWFWRLLVLVIRKGDRDRLLGLAAESAFFAILTLFPALLVVTSVLGQLGAIVGESNAKRVEEAVLDFLDALLTNSAGPAIATVEGLFESSFNLLTLASLLAVVSLSTAFAVLINTVNLVYDVPETRGWWRRRFLGLLLGIGSVLTGAVAVTLLVIGPLFGRGVDVIVELGLDQEYSFLWRYARWPVAFAALVLWATTLDHLAPARRTRWRHDLPGGLLTALLWLAASAGLSAYLQVVVPRSPVLGALGGGLILMTWFYLLGVALLAGAELNAILLARRRQRAGARAARKAGAERPEDPEPVAAPDGLPVPPQKGRR
jgi:membrane protein